MLTAAYRVTLVAFWLLFVAACVDDVKPLAWCFGLVAIGLPALRWWMRWERKTRRYDSMFPKADASQIETLDEIADEPSHTRRIRGNTPAKNDNGKVA